MFVCRSEKSNARMSECEAIDVKRFNYSFYEERIKKYRPMCLNSRENKLSSSSVQINYKLCTQPQQLLSGKCAKSSGNKRKS